MIYNNATLCINKSADIQCVQLCNQIEALFHVTPHVLSFKLAGGWTLNRVPAGPINAIRINKSNTGNIFGPCSPRGQPWCLIDQGGRGARGDAAHMCTPLAIRISPRGWQRAARRQWGLKAEVHAHIFLLCWKNSFLEQYGWYPAFLLLHISLSFNY